MYKPLFHGFNKVGEIFLEVMYPCLSKEYAYIKGEGMSPYPCNSKSCLGDM